MADLDIAIDRKDYATLKVETFVWLVSNMKQPGLRYFYSDGKFGIHKDDVPKIEKHWWKQMKKGVPEAGRKFVASRFLHVATWKEGHAVSA